MKIGLIDIIFLELQLNDEELDDVEDYGISEEGKNTFVEVINNEHSIWFNFTSISYGCYHPLAYTKENIYFLVYEDDFGADGVHKGSYCRIESIPRNPE